ncbi:MAG: hypothetical protein DHS20C21_22750 [Gemmatimonadota bacterium]|nr:MAG: hypothetical protein DHS20C21_22750 [Gemmatimonadota bacterium]
MKWLASRWSSVSVLGLLLTFAAGSASATITTFTDRAAWEAAVSGSFQEETFDGFPFDQFFLDGGLVDVPPFFQLRGFGDAFADGEPWNRIDVSPFSPNLGSLNGTPDIAARVANITAAGGGGGSPIVGFTINFGRPKRAWGCDWGPDGTAFRVVADDVVVGFAVSNGFFGFVDDSGSFSTVRIDADAGQSGANTLMDNFVFTEALITPCSDVARVSVDSAGNEGNGESIDSWISEGGRFIAFESSADNLVVGDNNSFRDIFVHDTMTGTTERVSVDSMGNEADDESGDPRITPDGRFVVFESLATNLVVDDTNGFRDVFIHDRMTGTTERLSVDSLGAEGNEESQDVFVSADGLIVTFESAADNLVADDFNGVTDCFVRDRTTGTTTRISVDSQGNEGNGTSDDPTISADGQFVAFESDADDLVPNDTNTRVDCFVHDRVAGTTVRVSVDSQGNQALGNSDDPVISSTGRFVVFESNAPNLDGDTLSNTHCFVHDLMTGETEIVSIDSQGNLGNEFHNDPKISDDGRFVVFESDSSNLVPDDNNFGSDIFLHNRVSGTTIRLSVACPGVEGNQESSDPSMSPSGSHVCFGSFADNLVTDDGNFSEDIFTVAIATCADGTVNDAAGSLTDVLFINGESRSAQVAEGDQLWGLILNPPAGGSGKFVVHANVGVPSPATQVALPAGIGTSCFQAFLTQGGAPIAIWNNAGRTARVGASTYFDQSSIPDPATAPVVFLLLFDGDPTNLPAGTTLTFQGISVDPGSSSSKGASTTNAVVLEVH